MNKKKILITGGAGYIGQNLTTFFIKQKYQISIIDNLSTSKPISNKIKEKILFYKIDLINSKKVKSFFKKKNFDLIIHLAAFSGVQEFNKNLKKSFNNNVLATKNIVKYGFKNKNTKLIFASSAAVYGKVSREKVKETNACNPANYYGLSKYACESVIENEIGKKENHYAILRYFNVVGSILDFNIKKKTKSLFDIIALSINKKNYKININGNKLKTLDGTPERDFIHIKDLSNIHNKVYSKLRNSKKLVLNCGSGERFSVLQIVKKFEKAINKKFKITYKVTNSDETQTICSDIKILKQTLKLNISKNKVSDFVKDYF